MSVNEKMTAIAEAIRDKTGGTDPLSLDGMAQAIPEVYEQGKQAQYDEFWDTYIDSVVASGKYWEMFSGRGWNDKTFKPHRNITPTGRTSNFFSGVKITDLAGILERQGIKINFSKATNCNYMIYDTTITHLPELDLTSATSLNCWMEWNSALVTIDKIIVGDIGLGSLWGTGNVQNVTFGGTIRPSISVAIWTKLSHDSLMSIINALYDYSADTSGTTHKVNLGSENIAKLTEEELNIIESKGWTYS